MGKYVNSFIVIVAVSISEILIVDSQANSDLGFWANILNFQQDPPDPGYTDTSYETDYDASDIVDYDNSDEDSNDSSMHMHNRYHHHRNMYNIRRRSRKRLLLEGMRRRNRLRNKLMKRLREFKRAHQSSSGYNRKSKMKVNGRRTMLRQRNRKTFKRFDDSDSVENIQRRRQMKGRQQRKHLSDTSVQSPGYRLKDFNEYRKSNVIRNRLVFPSQRRVESFAASTTEAVSQEESSEKTSVGGYSTLSTTAAVSQEESQEQTSAGGYSTLSTTQQSQEIDDDLMTTTPNVQPTQQSFDRTMREFGTDAMGGLGDAPTTQKMTTTESEREMEKEFEGSSGRMHDERYGARFANKTINGKLRNLSSGIKRTRENLTAIVQAVKDEGGLSNRTELTNIVSSVENSNVHKGNTNPGHSGTDLIQKQSLGNIDGVELSKVGAAVDHSLNTNARTVHSETENNPSKSHRAPQSRNPQTASSVQLVQENPSTMKTKSQLTNIVKSVYNDPNSSVRVNNSPLSKIINAVDTDKAPKKFSDSQFARDMEIHNSEIVANRKVNKETLHLSKDKSSERAPLVNITNKSVNSTPSANKRISSQNSLSTSSMKGTESQNTLDSTKDKGGKSIGITSLVRNTIVLDNKGHGKINGNGKHITSAEAMPSPPVQSDSADQTYTFEVVKPRSEGSENNINLANQFSEERIGIELKELPPLLPKMVAPEPHELLRTKQSQHSPGKSQAHNSTPSKSPGKSQFHNVTSKPGKKLNSGTDNSNQSVKSTEQKNVESLNKGSKARKGKVIHATGKALPLKSNDRNSFGKGSHVSSIEKDNLFHLSNKYSNDHLTLRRKNIQMFDDMYRQRAPEMKGKLTGIKDTGTKAIENTDNVSVALKSSDVHTNKQYGPTDKSVSMDKSGKAPVLNGKGKSRGITQNVIRKADIGPRLQQIRHTSVGTENVAKMKNSMQTSKLPKDAKSGKVELKTTVSASSKEVLSLRGPLSAPVKTKLNKYQNELSDTSNSKSNLIEKTRESARKTEKYPSKAKMISEGYPDDKSNGKHRSFVQLSDSQEVKGGFVNPISASDSKAPYIPVRVTKELGFSQMSNSHQRGFSSKEKRSGKHINLRRKGKMPHITQSKINYSPIKGNDAARPNQNSKTLSIEQISPKEIWSSREKNGNTVEKIALHVDASIERRHMLNLSRGRHIRLNGREKGQHVKGANINNKKNNDIEQHKNRGAKSYDLDEKTKAHAKKTSQDFRQARLHNQIDTNTQTKTANQNTKRNEINDAMNKKLALLVNRTLESGEISRDRTKLHLKKQGSSFASTKENMLESKRHRVKGMRRGHGKNIDRILEEKVSSVNLPAMKSESMGGKNTEHNPKGNLLEQRKLTKSSETEYVTGQRGTNKLQKLPKHTQEKGFDDLSSKSNTGSSLTMDQSVRNNQQNTIQQKNKQNTQTKNAHNGKSTVLVIDNKEYNVQGSRNKEIYKGRGAIRPNDARRKGHARSSRKRKGIKPIRVSVSSVRRKKMTKGQTSGETTKGGVNPIVEVPSSSEFVHMNDNSIRKTEVPSGNKKTQTPSQDTSDYELVGKWKNGDFVNSLRAGNGSVTKYPNSEMTKSAQSSQSVGGFKPSDVLFDSNNGGKASSNQISLHNEGNAVAGNMQTSMKIGNGQKFSLELAADKTLDMGNKAEPSIRDKADMTVKTIRDKPYILKGDNTIASKERNNAISNIANMKPSPLSKSSTSTDLNIPQAPPSSNQNAPRALPSSNQNAPRALPSSIQNDLQNIPSLNNVRTNFEATADKNMKNTTKLRKMSKNKSTEFELEIENKFSRENESEREINKTTGSPMLTSFLPSSDGNDKTDDEIFLNEKTNNTNQIGPQNADYSEYPVYDDDNISSPPPIDSVDYEDGMVDDSWVGGSFHSEGEDDHAHPLYMYSDSNKDSSEEFAPREDSFEESRGGYSGEGYNIYSGSWIHSAQEHARERAEEMEGEWKDVNITRVGKPDKSTCPNYRVRYQDNAVVIDTVEKSCRIIITWNKRQKREERKEKTWWGTRVYYKSRTVYVPVVTYVDLR